MLNLDLNLASRPFKNDTLPWAGLGLAVVAITLLTVWNVRAYRQNSKWVEDLKEQYSTTRDELTQFDRRERGAQREIEGYDLEALHVRADKANEVILWKAFSWTRLFNLLQEVLPNDVQMISIRPIFRPQGADRGRNDELAGRVPVSVEGVAKSYSAFLSLERALLAHASFDRVEPEGHTQSRTGSLAFELKFLYDPQVDPLAAAAGADATDAATKGPEARPAGPVAGQGVDAGAADAVDAGAEPAGTANEMAPNEPVAPSGPASGEAVAVAGAGAETSTAGAPAVETVAPPETGEEPETKKQPKPPTKRRRGPRSAGAGDGKEGGR